MKIIFHNAHDRIQDLRMCTEIRFDSEDRLEAEQIHRLTERMEKNRMDPLRSEFYVHFLVEYPGLVVIPVDGAEMYEKLVEEILPEIRSELADEGIGVSADPEVERFHLLDEKDETLISGGERRRKRLFVDMDGTLAEFKVVEYQEQLFEEGYFRNLKPHENVVDAVRLMMEDHSDVEVFILSAYFTDSLYALEEKNLWLDEYLPEIDQDHRVFVSCGSDKSRSIKDFCPDDFLLDDYTVNLLSWDPPGRSIKLLNNINHTRGTWKEDCIRFDRPGDEIASLLYDVVAKGGHCYDRKIEPAEPALKLIL